jgi:hypothetical protein
MKRIILISEGQIFLAPGRSFPVSITKFPSGSIGFRTKAHQYWEVEATNDNGDLTFVVTNYHPTDFSAFDQQNIKAAIKSISFTGLNWQEFQLLLASYKLSDIRPFLDASTITAKSQPVVNNTKPERHMSNFILTPERMEILEEREESYEEEFQVSYEETRFRNGYVEFLMNFKWSPNTLLIRIDNPNIREEFEVIKNYFAKAINNRKKYGVKLKAKKTGFSNIEHTASSEDLDKINTELIDGVRLVTTKRLFSDYKKQTANKKVLTVEEIFENIEDYPNVFKQSDLDILAILAETYGLRNKLPLEYLSGKVHSTKQKVKFTLKPMFGFLFFIEGVTHDFFCWELLNTNATYLWKIQKDTGRSLQVKVEEEISLIHEIGREQYRKSIKEIPAKDLQFLFIDHKGIKNENEGFVDWKRRLLEAIN